MTVSFTYNAMPMNSSGIGYEVGAFYDNTSRNGLVVGSVTHDTWKTGVYFVWRKQSIEPVECLWRSNFAVGCDAAWVSGREYCFFAHHICWFWR